MEKLKSFLDSLSESEITRNTKEVKSFFSPNLSNYLLNDLINECKNTSHFKCYANEEEDLYIKVLSFKNVCGYSYINIHVTQGIHKRNRDLNGILVNLFY